MESSAPAFRTVILIGVVALESVTAAHAASEAPAVDARARLAELLNEMPRSSEEPGRFVDTRLSFAYFQSTEAPPAKAEGASEADVKPEDKKPGEAKPGEAEGSTDNEHSLATKLQNPVADLISVPFQFNWDTGIGPDEDKDKITINVQPVIPFHISESWNLISRTIVPIVYAEGPVDGIDDEFGLGDTTQSFFFSPRDPVGGWILGFGPAALIPTGTDDLFRTKQVALGPTAVALSQFPLGEGTLTYGGLVNHLWKVGGDDDVPDVNATYMQPFISYTLKTGTTFGLNAETTYDWTSEQWTVPINATFSQLVRVGRLPVQFQFGGRYYFDAPRDGPEWGIRCAITLLFPN